jgi:hypothetical protein
VALISRTFSIRALEYHLETEPELISAIGVDGTEGYVLKRDLDVELPKSPEEAIAIQNSRSPGGRDISLYIVFRVLHDFFQSHHSICT